MTCFAQQRARFSPAAGWFSPIPLARRPLRACLTATSQNLSIWGDSIAASRNTRLLAAKNVRGQQLRLCKHHFTGGRPSTTVPGMSKTAKAAGPETPAAAEISFEEAL